jgi:hypothetical protein
MTQLRLMPGTATSIGSLPHLDADEAAAFVVDRHPELPAAPQLPRRSARDGMLAEAALGISGIEVDREGALVVDADRFEATVDGVPDAATLPDTLAAFLRRLEGRTEPVKLQLTGPVTLGVALVRAGVAPEAAFAVAGAAVGARARSLVGEAASEVPHAPLVLFLDEPGLTCSEHPGFPLARHGVTDVLSGVLSELEVAATGVHCCGPTDWAAVVEAGPDILSLPAPLVAATQPLVFARFLEAGGRVAWGAVPTDGPVSDDVGLLWRRLVATWCDLVRGGCDPVLLRSRSLVTPACGLAGHGLSQADLALRLARELGRRAHDQALVSRLSVGA